MAEARTAINRKTKQIFRIHKDKVRKRKACSDHALAIQGENTIPKQFPEKEKLGNLKVEMYEVECNFIHCKMIYTFPLIGM